MYRDEVRSTLKRLLYADGPGYSAPPGLENSSRFPKWPEWLSPEQMLGAVWEMPTDMEEDMVQVTRSVTIEAPVEKVREIVRFDDITWHPAVVRTDVAKSGGKRVRTLTVEGTDLRVVESLVREDGTSHTYRMVSRGPLPVMSEEEAGAGDTVYEGTVTIEGRGASTVVTWRSNDYSPAGASAAESEAATRDLYEAGLQALKKRLEGAGAAKA